MPRVSIGNHGAHIVARTERERVRRFYVEALGARIMRVRPDADDLRLGENFYMSIMYGDQPDESEFQRSGKSIWLELKSDDVQETTRRILRLGGRMLAIPDPHLYFQAPGGQVFRLVGVDEDLAKYEGTGEGPDVARVTEAIAAEAARTGAG